MRDFTVIDLTSNAEPSQKKGLSFDWTIWLETKFRLYPILLELEKTIHATAMIAPENVIAQLWMRDTNITTAAPCPQITTPKPHKPR